MGGGKNARNRVDLAKEKGIRQGQNTFSLALLFAVITACGLFFAIFQLSPLLAMASIIVSTPAIIRTIIYFRRHRKKTAEDVGTTAHVFLSSLLIVVSALGVGVLTTFAICSLFGLFAVMFERSMGGSSFQSIDVFFLGGMGGLILAMGVGLITFYWAIHELWKWGMPEESHAVPSTVRAANRNPNPFEVSQNAPAKSPE